jgi:hypothetical protein
MASAQTLTNLNHITRRARWPDDEDLTNGGGVWPHNHLSPVEKAFSYSGIRVAYPTPGGRIWQKCLMSEKNGFQNATGVFFLSPAS